MMGNARDMVMMTAEYVHANLKQDDIDEYIRLAQVDTGLMAWSMSMEHVYGRDHAWAYDHIGNPGLAGCAPGNDMRLKSHGGDIMVLWKGRATSMDVLLRLADSINGDLFAVLSAMGWEGLISLWRIMGDFPYREYGMTRDGIIGIVSGHCGKPGEVHWIMETLAWMMSYHPIIKGGLTAGWVDDNIEYPFDFMRETCIHESMVSMRKYRSARSALMSMIPQGGIHDALSQNMDPDGRSATGTPWVNSRNIDRWMKVMARLMPLLGDDDSRSMLAAVSSVPEEFSGFNVYPAIRKGSGMRNMSQMRSVSLEYAEHASASHASFTRWMQWIRLQGEMGEDKIIAAYTDDRKIINMPFGNPFITSFPKGLAAWLDSGMVPKSLRLNSYVTLTLPPISATRMLRPLTECA